MKNSTALHELLYVSTLAPNAAMSAPGDIAREARLKNLPLAITGLLVFDGARFCQHLEGTIRTVAALYERIVADKRHINVTLLHNGAAVKRKFAAFAMAYCDMTDTDVLARLEGLSGAEAVAVFDEMCLTLDPL